jgi:hypothetical protein
MMKKAEEEAVSRLVEDKLILQEAKKKGIAIQRLAGKAPRNGSNFRKKRPLRSNSSLSPLASTNNSIHGIQGMTLWKLKSPVWYCHLAHGTDKTERNKKSEK